MSPRQLVNAVSGMKRATSSRPSSVPPASRIKRNEGVVGSRGIQRERQGTSPAKSSPAINVPDREQRVRQSNQVIPRSVRYYASGYDLTSPLKDQLLQLWRFFPELEGELYDARVVRPQAFSSTEGYLLVPRWQALNEVEDQWDATEKLIRIAEDKDVGDFFVYRGEIGRDLVSLSERTTTALDRIAQDQANFKVLVFPVQLGLRNRGRSVNFVENNYQRREFGLDIFSGLCAVLTNDKRLAGPNDLHMACPGTNVRDSAKDNYTKVPYMCYKGGTRELGADLRTDCVDRGIGCATGLVPRRLKIFR